MSQLLSSSANGAFAFWKWETACHILSYLSLIFVRAPVANPVFPFFLKPVCGEKKNLIPWGF